MVRAITSEIFNGDRLIVCETEEEFHVEKDKHLGFAVYSPREIKFLWEEKRKGNDNVIYWLHHAKKQFGGEIVLDVEQLRPVGKMTIAERRNQIREGKNNSQSDPEVPERDPGVQSN